LLLQDLRARFAVERVASGQQEEGHEPELVEVGGGRDLAALAQHLRRDVARRADHRAV